MAIWQFSVDFIPRKNLVQRFGYVPKIIDEEILWKESLDEGVQLPISYEDFLNVFGTKEILKWTKQSFNWGDYDSGSHITISYEDKTKISVFCRLHVGDWNEEFAETILEFAKKCDCVLLTKNQTIIEPEINLLVGEVRKSNSFRFCNNPIEYLQSDEVKQIDQELKKRFSR